MFRLRVIRRIFNFGLLLLLAAVVWTFAIFIVTLLGPEIPIEVAIGSLVATPVILPLLWRYAHPWIEAVSRRRRKYLSGGLLFYRPDILRFGRFRLKRKICSIHVDHYMLAEEAESMAAFKSGVWALLRASNNCGPEDRAITYTLTWCKEVPDRFRQLMNQSGPHSLEAFIKATAYLSMYCHLDDSRLGGRLNEQHSFLSGCKILHDEWKFAFINYSKRFSISACE